MSVLHCTRKLAGKLSAVSAAPLEEQVTLGSWHATLARFDRVQCVLFCHDDTRYCLFLPRLRAQQFAELGRWHRELFLASLAVEGVADAAIARAGLALGPPRYDSKTDRSVLGTMNIALDDLQAYVADAAHILAVDPLLLSRRINNRPVMAKGRPLWPGKAMRERVTRL